MGHKGYAKWGGMADSYLPYRTPDWKLESCIRVEESSILVHLFYVSLLVIWSNF